MQRQIVRSVLQRLESLERAGVTYVKKVPKKASPLLLADRTPAATPASITPPSPAAQPPTAAVTREAALAAVACDVAACARCTELASTRTQTVFGDGNPHARLVFCGEAPGADEDRIGKPFVGRAGQLLTDIIVKGMKMRREDVYILNILRCRPPGNRTPLPAEAANCREYLDRQLAIIQPQFLCCLGAVAAQNLLATDLSIGKLRGRVHDLNGVKVVCTYHPAYLLRNPDAKKFVWDDIKMLMAEMEKK
jgi:uracil-DNA glycosylase